MRGAALGDGGVGILIGSHRYLGHEATEIGFRSCMRDFAPDMRLGDGRALAGQPLDRTGIVTGFRLVTPENV